jgi:oligo-1,6-glucosidase
MTMAKNWWKEGTVYQIYPSSFCDSNGDGIGDIPGIISKLDYIKQLGVDIIWLSPHYKSPQVDMGYDISDYKDIHRPYGTLEDCQALIDGCHERGMKIIFDLVVNHTSDQHDWFLESRKSTKNPKRNWYIWKDPKYDSEGNRVPPNNWMSTFQGSAWEWDETTQQYYLHLFAKQQPDLNWENPETREAIYADALNFWLERGVNGFRIDVVALYSKDQRFLDAPDDNGSKYYYNGPRMHEFLKEMYNKTFGRYDTFTVGELGNFDPNVVFDYVGASRKELSEVFLFDHVSTGRRPEWHVIDDWKLPELKLNISKTQTYIDGNDSWSTVYLENHDQPRSISRFASDKPQYRTLSGKLLAILLTTMSGTLYVYQGQEIGMTNFSRSWPIEDYKDVDAQNYYRDTRKSKGNGVTEWIMDNLQKMARDHARTPFQWDDSRNAGFTTGEPWMRVNDNYNEINVKSQIDDTSSVLNFWKQALKLRKENKNIFVYGSFQLRFPEDENLFIVVKESEGRKALVVMNFTADAQKLLVPNDLKELKLLLTNVPENKDTNTLAPYEGRIYLEV